MTFQYNEMYVPFATERQAEDFQAMADAGAVIVSGSQSHFPQGFAFRGNSFVHYGLGNLFFDQMDTPVEGTRREFLDRHVFYDGRLHQHRAINRHVGGLCPASPNDSGRAGVHVARDV